MRCQGAHGRGPQPLGHIVISPFDPFVQTVTRVGQHDRFDFGFPLEAVVFELSDDVQGAVGRATVVAHHMPMRWGNELNVALLANGMKNIERIQIGTHATVWRIHNRGAPIENVVATEENAFFFQHQAQVIGRMSWRVDDPQGVAAVSYTHSPSPRDS